ncbi:MAG: type ISP restriction/modification enzyme [Patescibacteria group bacterium]|mgnify:CR=1 FL=1
MSNVFEQYLQSVAAKFAREETSEMGYRADFETLLKEVFAAVKNVHILHDAKARQGNKPDFVVLSHNVPILYIEVKDIGVPLDKIEKSEQMARYYGYANLVLTDYVEFRFYRNGLRYEEPIVIAKHDLKQRTITPVPAEYEHLAKTSVDFAQSHKEPIKSGKHLAKIMGGKGQRIRDNARQFLSHESEKNTEIMQLYEAIKKMLVHDLTIDAFADMYAQTLVYGLFTARYNDETPATFSRQEADQLVPASNPFLKQFFDHIAGVNFDKRLGYIVDELCEVFQHADIKKLVEEFLDDADPIIHFYEDFLKEYDPVLRKRMGAYYTPLPVVNFIIRSVDEILRRDFGLARGLADTAKLDDGKHKVQILDPAAGTGTFISATIDKIYQAYQEHGQGGGWPSYVHHELLPRLHGFELMMVPYTIAHLKISMKLRDTGFKHFNETRNGKTRLKVFLTNSLEDPKPQGEIFSLGFGGAIAEEAKSAAVIKNDTPIMVVIGNPPYSVSSSNKGAWIQNLIQDYKRGLGERKINLDDDYIKFIRYAEHFIEKNKSGVVAMITNNSYIDGITHRQMRKHLLETFDDVYILDLHGNSKKKEQAPDGGQDENVFDIQQGVAISIFVRTAKEKTGLGQVHHAEIYGKREDKFTKLNESDIKNLKWVKLDCPEPNYFFVPKDFNDEEEYRKGLKIDEVFNEFNSGIQTKRDGLVYQFTNNEIANVLNDFTNLEIKELRSKYDIADDGRDWTVNLAREDVQGGKGQIVQVTYHPFEQRFTYYSGKTKGFMAYPRSPLMKSMLNANLSLITVRNSRRGNVNNVFVSNKILDKDAISPFDNSRFFPLYLYYEDGTKTPNLIKEIVSDIEKRVGKVTPENILDYIYAVLHSPSYRDKYKEFLKIDFPRVPYPKDAITFKKLVALGTELRLLHLLESPQVNKFITTYPATGSDMVEKIAYKDNKVFINTEQYFGQVPELAWNFYIGGYQPAQKWLKDRKGRTLTNEDIEHYQQMIVALLETGRIMGEIDKLNK